MQVSNFGGTFVQFFLWIFMKFSQKMPLYFFYTMHGENIRMTKNSNQGSCLDVNLRATIVIFLQWNSVITYPQGKWKRYVLTRVHKNKSMQHHTLGSGTAEFQVTWPPKLREGTYLVKNVRARFEYRKTIAAHEKQVIMQEKAQPCASLWRKTLRPKRVRFLAIDAPIVDYVCLPLYHLTFLGSYQPLCEFSWRKRKKKRDKRVQVSSINSRHESVVYRAALPHRYTILYNTQKSRYLKFRRARAP